MSRESTAAGAGHPSDRDYTPPTSPGQRSSVSDCNSNTYELSSLPVGQLSLENDEIEEKTGDTKSDQPRCFYCKNQPAEMTDGEFLCADCRWILDPGSVPSSVRSAVGFDGVPREMHNMSGSISSDEDPR